MARLRTLKWGLLLLRLEMQTDGHKWDSKPNPWGCVTDDSRLSRPNTPVGRPTEQDGRQSASEREGTEKSEITEQASRWLL